MSSQGTLLQGWSKSCTISVAILVSLLHISAFIVAAYLCPELFIARTYTGVHCQPSGDINSFTLASDNSDCDDVDYYDVTAGEGVCLTRDGGDVVTLEDIRMSFKFPSDQNNYREHMSVWNWRMIGSVGISLNVMEQDFPVDHSNNTDFDQEVLLSASIDYAPLQYLQSGTIQNTGGCIPSSPWHSKAIVLNVNRTLNCKLHRKLSSHEYKSDIDIHCSLHPFFELLVLSNSSYIVQVRLQKLVDGHDLDILSTNATISSYLTLAKETDSYHRTFFYTKCLFTPLVVMALVWFMVRLCLNDLYVTIHDRLLITAGLAQIVNNVPSEVIVANYPDTYITLLDPLSHIVLVTSLALFWAVFTLDKLADNEPWERTTRYYWRPLTFILISASLALLGVLFLRLPPLNNPFTSHWLLGPSPTIYISLGFTFTVAIIIATFHTYLSVIVFRVVCDISVRYPGQSRGAWRLKMLMMYCLLISVITCLGCILRLAVTLCLHWNIDNVHTDPLPFSVSGAGIYYLGEIAASNIHLISLLILLSRSSRISGGGGWYTPVSPVLYSPAPREEQLHLWDLAAHPSPLQK